MDERVSTVSGISIRTTTVYPETAFVLSNGTNITTLFWEGAEIAQIEKEANDENLALFGCSNVSCAVDCRLNTYRVP